MVQAVVIPMHPDEASAMKREMSVVGIEGNWLRVFDNAAASHMADGARQPLHSIEGRSEKCVTPY